MTMNIGVLCSGDGRELAALLAAAGSGRLPAEIKIVIADRDGPALTLARTAGLSAALIPRSAYHANRDGFERRLAEVFSRAEADMVVLAGFDREIGPVLSEAFPGKIIGRDLGPDELAAGLEREIRSGLFSLVSD